jgi:hypothetical protein
MQQQYLSFKTAIIINKPLGVPEARQKGRGNNNFLSDIANLCKISIVSHALCCNVNKDMLISPNA